MVKLKVGDLVWIRPAATEGLDCGPIYIVDHGIVPAKPLAGIVTYIRPDTLLTDPFIINVAVFDTNAQLRSLSKVPFYTNEMKKPELSSITFAEWPSNAEA
jgi:hypothetical protein